MSFGAAAGRGTNGLDIFSRPAGALCVQQSGRQEQESVMFFSPESSCFWDSAVMKVPAMKSS
jgi:hypothetical protein